MGFRHKEAKAYLANVSGGPSADGVVGKEGRVQGSKDVNVRCASVVMSREDGLEVRNAIGISKR